jgi:hypothetical protein
MRLVSFDVGIKHLAACSFVVGSDLRLAIQSWQLLDLACEPPVQHCACNKKAKYVSKDSVFFCERHAKQRHPQFLLPSKVIRLKDLKKMDAESLAQLSASLSLPLSSTSFGPVVKETKQKWLERLTEIYATRALLPYKPNVSAASLSLVDIGRNLKRKLDTMMADDMAMATHVIIENQISPIASRMKTVQGLLSQYVIMKRSDDDQPTIEFISSANKLHHFMKKREPKQEDEKEEVKEKVFFFLFLFLFENSVFCILFAKFGILYSFCQIRYSVFFLPNSVFCFLFAKFGILYSFCQIR